MFRRGRIKTTSFRPGATVVKLKFEFFNGDYAAICDSSPSLLLISPSRVKTDEWTRAAEHGKTSTRLTMESA